MSNDITKGKRVLFRLRPEDATLTPGIVASVDGVRVVVLANGTEHETSLLSQASGDLKLGTQDTDPAAWMLHDGFTSTPMVFRAGCYICEDPEFARMGLPLCRKCPECVRQGRGPGHIAADETACDECGYEETPADYPQPEPVPPYTAKAEATTTPPGEPYSPATDLVDIPGQAVSGDGKETIITVPKDCTVQGVMIWDSSDPPRSIYWMHVGKALRAGDSVHVPGTFDVVAG